MNCPFCGKEMKEGTIASHDFLVWFPLEHEVRHRDFSFFEFRNAPWKKHGITLAHKQGVCRWVNKNPGWICTQCKKAVLDWDENKVSYTQTYE